MGIGARVTSRALSAGSNAVDAATGRLQRTNESFRSLRAILNEDDRPASVEGLLVGLVAAVRDERDEDRSRRDVFEAARNRRRALGLVSFGAGPLTAVANQLVGLYDETATVCDLADVHGLNLNEEQIAAHMLVLWSIVDDLDVAQAAVSGTGERPVATIIADGLFGGASIRMPEQLTTRTAIRMLWEARGVVGEARDRLSSGPVRGVVFAGHRTKRLIKQAERQLGVR